MSIRQNPAPTRLPDFGNLGVMLRCLLGVNLLALFAALARNTALARLPEELVELAALVEPPLIASVVLLYAAGRPLARLPYAAALAAVMLASAALAALFMALFTPPGVPPPSPLRAALWAAAAAAAVLLYFDLRHRAFSPALTEARLMALTARIRPHFLFNSLNAVLGVIRSDPRRAEQALEELSDLFRVLMAENKQLVTLGEEIALCRQYLDLEHLRLGERLRVAWDIEGCPADAQVPPLMLQPLLENAVYHGIEPCTEPATVTIRAERAGEEIRIVLSNPYHGENAHHAGNRMALDNIRERLMLFYDLEARLDTEAQEGLFRATIRLPYRRGGTA
ncbi:MAG TPA: histidine kinase [Candidatus Desulfobacillus denitrificans]|nr:histidine kinase [Candidatus Desulfobacillus denitrificans]